MPKISTVASTEDSYEIPKNQILDAATLINDGSLLCYVKSFIQNTFGENIWIVCYSNKKERVLEQAKILNSIRILQRINFVAFMRIFILDTLKSQKVVVRRCSSK